MGERRPSSRLAVVGHVEWVEFARVPRMPAAGDIVHAERVWSEPAGGGAVVARQLALLAGRCELFTALGDDDRWSLGPRVGELASAAGPAPSLNEAAGPALEALRDATGESVQLFVRRGRVRVCTASMESPHSLRTIVPVGALPPLLETQTPPLNTAAPSGASNRLVTFWHPAPALSEMQ